MKEHVAAAPPPGMEPFFLADHPALDMLNTLAASESGPIEFWQSDADVTGWLERQGMAQGRVEGRWAQGALAAAARRLRETVRELVARRKAGRRPLDTAPLNEFLARGASHLELCGETAKALHVERRYGTDSPEALLAPLAESAAGLLAEGDFELVRRCEGQGCVLWFYDRTKAHRRRWCSMSVCGNRAKVAAFRQRQA